MNQSFPKCCCRFLKTKTEKPIGIVIFLCGFDGHIGEYRHLIRAWFDVGCHVLVIYLPGHAGRGKLIQSILFPGALIMSTLRAFARYKKEIEEMRLPILLAGFSTGFPVMVLVMQKLATLMPEIGRRIKGIFGWGGPFRIMHHVSPFLAKLAAFLGWLVTFFDRWLFFRSRTWGLGLITIGKVQTYLQNPDPKAAEGAPENNDLLQKKLSVAWALLIYTVGRLAWEALPKLKCQVELFYGAGDTITEPILPHEVGTGALSHVIVHPQVDGPHNCMAGETESAEANRTLFVHRMCLPLRVEAA